MFVVTEIIIKVIITDILLLVLKNEKIQFHFIIVQCFCAKKEKEIILYYISPARLKIWDLILSASR